MADAQRHLSERERAEIVGALSPLVDRLQDRFGVSRSAILNTVAGAVRIANKPSLPASYKPKHPLLARLVAAASAATDLSPASVAEDTFAAARDARDAVVYVARTAFDLSYETIGAALGNQAYDAVMDSYCRAIGRVEATDKDFSRLARLVEQGGRR